MSGKTIRVWTDAEFKAGLERADRPWHVTLDELRDRGLLAPDRHFLFKRVAGCDADKVNDTARRALLDLLRNHLRLGIPLSQLRNVLEISETKYRQEGVKRPRGTAKKQIAKHFGHNSGEALRKALQPNRVNRRPRHKPRS
jgi:hypothetical protein